MVRTVDVHNHLYPKIWLDYLEKRTKSPTMKWTGPTSIVFYAEDVIVAHVDRAGHYDPVPRIEDMDRYGLDTQILSLTIPGVEELPTREGVTWARKINDYYADLSQKYPGRFYFCAALPYQDVNQAVKELERAHKDLGAKGITMFSNINGKPVASPEFEPIYAKANEYELPILVHPTTPLTRDAMKKVRLPFQLFGYTLDTTMAVIGLIFQGVLEKYPKLKLIHSHLGGVAPYTVGRMEDSFKGYAKEWGIELPQTPSYYYRRQVYPDSINYHEPSLRCCLAWMGADHICLGTDYAHRVGRPEKAVAYIKDLGLSKEDTNKILGGNAARIFKLE